MRISLLTAFALFALLLPALGRDAREQARIDYLINGVEQAKDVVFIRNGSEHNAAEAASHLRMKLNYAGERVKTAEQFVKYCASESSLTHRPYHIRLPDGKTLTAADYFAGKLREFDSGKH